MQQDMFRSEPLHPTVYEALKTQDVPVTFDKELPLLTEEQVRKEIADGKKPMSIVKGDIYCDILVSCLDILAKPICMIFNNVTKTATWPAAWKVEHVTVIPKCKSPETEADCRNISCTNVLSKVYERIVLKQCQEYVQPKDNQFGGQKGCSTYHFVAEALEQISENLEDSRAASMLTSIDYSKAFNRIEHLPLLQAFAQKGTPTYLLKILVSFLSVRWITVKLGNSRSDLRLVNAGAPQGSVLGTYVFNVATDNLEDGLVYDNVPIPENDLTFLETQPSSTNAQSTPGKQPMPQVDCSPIIKPSQDSTFLPTARNIPDKLRKRIEPSWREKPHTVRKFVDDNLQIKKFQMQRMQSYAEGSKISKTKE